MIRAYTQGLLVVDGVMYESTGQRGESGVRIVDFTTGEILKTRPISSQLFGEGLASIGGLLIQLTWTSGQALVFQRGLVPAGYAYRYEGEGWGLTAMGTSSSRAMAAMAAILDPKDEGEARVRVTAGGVPVDQLNELSSSRARSGPTSGRAIGRADRSGHW